mmetsp:Transcript_2580/g.6534  ORF Transcript_2580/g.6534 Transcript_2580/m.6534 type:complete len:326 (-) Transcript_2580:43-1020(-)
MRRSDRDLLDRQDLRLVPDDVLVAVARVELDRIIAQAVELGLVVRVPAASPVLVQHSADVDLALQHGPLVRVWANGFGVGRLRRGGKIDCPAAPTAAPGTEAVLLDEGGSVLVRLVVKRHDAALVAGGGRMVVMLLRRRRGLLLLVAIERVILATGAIFGAVVVALAVVPRRIVVDAPERGARAAVSPSIVAVVIEVGPLGSQRHILWPLRPDSSSEIGGLAPTSGHSGRKVHRGSPRGRGGRSFHCLCQIRRCYQAICGGGSNNGAGSGRRRISGRAPKVQIRPHQNNAETGHNRCKGNERRGTHPALNLVRTRRCDENVRSHG